MPTLHLTRTSEYVNRLRNYKIYIDDRFVSTIKNGGIVDFDIAPGSHTIYAKIDWCYSPTSNFTVSENETVDFKVGAFKKATWVILLMMFSCIVSIIINRLLDFPYLIILGLLGLAIVMYYITFGRKKYLTLEGSPQ